MPKKIDCITFFSENFMFEFRYNVLKNFIDYFVVCESIFDHKGNKKELNFKFKDYYDKNKIKYFVLEDSIKKENDTWKNQAIQREYLLNQLSFANDEDYIFFSDPDEIPNPEILYNFDLNKKYGIFMQKCFNYKFNLFNPYESPWEGTRVSRKKDLKSIDHMRQKILSKNLKYNFWRIDKEKNIELILNAGWHFNNIADPFYISKKLKTFAHSEFAKDRYSLVEIIEKKINDKVDLFERGHKYKKVELDSTFPKYLIENIAHYKDFILM
tara:strand:- start:686 stop:1492 length:807 start_codon:yes stop_codon:yes gene_type:complete